MVGDLIARVPSGGGHHRLGPDDCDMGYNNNQRRLGKKDIRVGYEDPLSVL